MLSKINFKLFSATLLSFALINSVNLPQPNQNLAKWSSTSNEALARSSGGRSGGGSFRSSPSRSSGSSHSSGSSSSSTKSTSPSHSNSGGSSTSKQNSAPANSHPSNTTTGATGGRAVGGNLEKSTSSSPPVPSTIQTNPVPITPHTTVKPNYSTRSRSIFFFNIDNDNNQGISNVVNNSNSGVSSASNQPPGSFWLVFVLGGIVLLLICGGIVVFIFSTVNKRQGSMANKERDNDIVTVSKLQLALLANTQGLQSQLSDLTRNVNTELSEGLLELLQESALVLLRNADKWSHVLATSQTSKIDKAEALFNEISIQERSKFTMETLTNVHGTVKEKVATISEAKQDVGLYIIVTLLVGTADDKPLFKEVRTVESLKKALEKVASVRSDYIMKVELLWSPQEEGNSLTYDELLTEYTNMIQIS